MGPLSRRRLNKLKSDELENGEELVIMNKDKLNRIYSGYISEGRPAGFGRM